MNDTEEATQEFIQQFRKEFAILMKYSTYSLNLLILVVHFTFKIEYVMLIDSKHNHGILLYLRNLPFYMF